MKKKYVTPDFQEISLYMEGEIALNISSDPDNKKIGNENQILSNKKSGGWDSSLWSSDEETTPNE